MRAMVGGAQRGVLLVATAGVFWSLHGVALRSVEVASTEQVVFWRSVAQIVSMLIIVAVASSGRIVLAFRRAGPLAVIGGLCGMVASTSFVFAVNTTTVANVVFIMAAAPLFAACGGWLLMRERIDRATLLAMAVALAGIGIMVGAGLARGSLLGYVYALGATVGFAGIAVVARRGAGVDMLPMACWGGMFTLVVGLVMCGGDVAVPPRDALAAMISGGVLAAGGATCFMRGARYVPSGALVFLSFTEIVLAPLWVWWLFDEVAGISTLIGGSVVLLAMLVEGVRRTRNQLACDESSGETVVSEPPDRLR